MKLNYLTFSSICLTVTSLIILGSPAISLADHRSPITLASRDLSNQQQGKKIILNGRSLPVSWRQWTVGNSARIAMGDTGARQLLGMDFLSTNDPKKQPINWFNLQTLSANLINSDRWLDVTDILLKMVATTTINGDSLTINFPAPQIQDIQLENYGAVQRIIIQLDRPTFWQVSQAKNQAVITLEGNAQQSLISKFQPQTISNSNQNNDEDDLGNSNNNLPTQITALENNGVISRLKINLPTAYGLQISSVDNPPRIIIDSRPDAMDEKRIVWQPGLIWNQKYIQLDKDWFPVTWLEIDPKNPQITIKPITANSTSMRGTNPLITINSESNAVAMINGGFFNRNNQLPLGAIRVDGKWLSGPILNRGAIAWDNRGKIRIDRLSLEETLITATGQRFPLTHLNSAFLTAGCSRYTRDWGSNYHPLTERETGLVVQGDRVTEKLNNLLPQDSIDIPENGYLVICRKTEINLNIGERVNLDSVTLPRDFADYPQILGAGPLLLQNGRIVLDGNAEKFSPAFQNQQASRSAIAVSREGKILLVAIHNRVGGRGATLGELARILLLMTATDGLNLDGGSSTGIALGGYLLDRSAVTAAKVHNGIGIFLSPSP
ncbi:MAG: phosphodiester glycosidase family protein [Microcystis viridis Mv_BB_P_19951000_S69]|uniref:Phosphodiester glycosidase family protein n=1 Tax=Microcystis viridis Mv_BB_P_19951000_S68D TaxID=2486270 RepID=A0A552HWF3_MICVR|nr:MAG: phosphodiester glycosidase family protein [Microcystis viridis Mv_BB_P_19951000_S68]TRU70261.1 MAG: phosphodiester glycosidase family protein [Microcystis viridis Mv_BB_P_19951000_S69]TRU75552.1 MAG: phosphodiester glycosidase family protein [Microcystis viridis Mv_BB_P_19951000_S68D]TRU85796.1 MAG: phosphodiester glycosidase family protein [Microcystis viridis Mv_BB_P_19951000_S69D]